MKMIISTYPKIKRETRFAPTRLKIDVDILGISGVIIYTNIRTDKTDLITVWP